MSIIKPFHVCDYADGARQSPQFGERDSRIPPPEKVPKQHTEPAAREFCLMDLSKETLKEKQERSGGRLQPRVLYAFDEGRDGAVEDVGDGAEEFGFARTDFVVSSDGVGAGVEHRFLE